MSSSDATKGQAALAASDYPTAIKHLTLALTNQPSNPSPAWLTQRSIAYQRTGEYALALADADNALLAAIKRGKRELIATAHFRRAVALHGLGRFGDARLCLNWCGKLNEKEKGFTIWMAKLKGDYEAAGGDDAECNSISVKEIPDPVEDVHKVVVLEPKQIIKGKGKEKQSVGIAPKPLAAAPTTTPTPKEKIRTEWYQSPSTVTIEVFAKGIPKDNIEVKIEKESVSILIPSPAGIALTSFSLRSASQSQLRTAHTTIPFLPSSAQSMLQSQAFGSHHTSLKLFYKNSCQEANGHPSKAPNKLPSPSTLLTDQHQPPHFQQESLIPKRIRYHHIPHHLAPAQRTGTPSSRKMKTKTTRKQASTLFSKRSTRMRTLIPREP